MTETGLPCRVRTALRMESAEAHTEHMQNLKANAASSSNLVRHSMAKQLDEPGAANAAAISKILRLPG